MFTAVSVVVSTIYLGIHWLVDIIAGSVLAVAVVYFLFHLDFKLRISPARLKRGQSPLFVEDVKWKGNPWPNGKVHGSKETVKCEP